MTFFQLTDEISFPLPELAEPDGLLAVGGDLSPERLITAYKSGIFPWFSENDPILWWYTNPRLVIFPEEFRVAKRLQRDMKKKPFHITIDTAFQQVIRGCSKSRGPARKGTWITKSMEKAYIRLYELGYAHSVECWQDNCLAGGLYGLALGSVFFGESMFTRITNSSKIALVHLVQYLQAQQFTLIDCQMTTSHLLGFGAREISGPEFQKHLGAGIKSTAPDGRWKNDNK